MNRSSISSSVLVFSKVVTGCACLMACASGFAATTVPPVTNIVVIYMDDLGSKDVGYNGSLLGQTPHIDRLAKQGMVFRQAYSAAPICSASRVALLTGHSPAREHFEFVTKWPKDRVSEDYPLIPPPFTYDLPLDRTTIAEALAPTGMVTALAGKWHVASHHGRYNGWSLTHGPAQQGFSVTIDEVGSHPSGGPLAQPAGSFVEGEYPADALTQRSITFLNDRAQDKKPFFLLLSHYYPHEPVGNVPDWLVAQKQSQLGEKLTARQVKYAAFIQQTDHYVGQLLDAMEANSLAERTVVIFTSDNGGSPDYARSAPLRGSKWNLYEAGIRVPFIVRWPGVTPPGGTCDVPVTGTDLFPTLCEMAGAAIDPANPMDGKSIVPLLQGKSPQELIARPLYWHFPYYTPERKRPDLTAGIGVDTNSSSTINPPMSAIRSGDFKLIYFYEDQRSELYDLKNDESESSDLSHADPARAKQLHDELFRVFKSVDARFPEPKAAMKP